MDDLNSDKMREATEKILTKHSDSDAGMKGILDIVNNFTELSKPVLNLILTLKETHSGNDSEARELADALIISFFGGYICEYAQNTDHAYTIINKLRDCISALEQNFSINND